MASRPPAAATASTEPEKLRSSSRRGAILAACGCAVLLLLFATISWTAAFGKCATFDEPLDVVESWANTWRADYRICPADPALWSYWAGLPLGRNGVKANFAAPSWHAALGDMAAQYTFSDETMYRTPGNDADSLLRRSRAMMLILGVLTGACIALWGWKLAGPAAAICAVVLFCLDPNFLAHAPLVKNDVAIALATIACFMTAWAVGRRASVANILLLGLLCGAAACVKFTGLILGPCILLLLIARALLPWEWDFLGAKIARTGAKVLAAIGTAVLCALLSWGVIWGCYRFRTGPTPDPSQHMNSSALLRTAIVTQLYAKQGYEPTAQQIAAHRAPLPMRLMLWAEERHLLPEAWTNGFLLTYGNTRVRDAYLMGERRLTGWWYYFPLAILFKTPLATLAALLLAVWLLLRSSRRLSPASAPGWWTFACLAIPMYVITMAAMSGNINLGIRHVLLLYPLAYVAVGIGFAHFWSWRRNAALMAGLILATGLAAETFAAYPDYIPFFNVAVGGSRGGAALLGDSNIDWGQDLPLLAPWQREHPGVPLYLCYFGTADPAYYGIQYINMPGSDAPDRPYARPRTPGVVAISVTSYQGLYLSTPQLQQLYAPLRDHEPIAILGGSIYIFDQDALRP